MSFDAKGTLNKVMLIGRLGQDPELKQTTGGSAFLNLSVATNTSYKDSSGQVQENTEWHRVTVWRKLAEIIAQYGKKGMRVYVEGKLQTRSWDKDGQKHFATEVIAETVQILEKKDGENSATSESGNRTLPNNYDGGPYPEQVPEKNPMEPEQQFDDDLPF